MDISTMFLINGVTLVVFALLLLSLFVILFKYMKVDKQWKDSVMKELARFDFADRSDIVSLEWDVKDLRERVTVLETNAQKQENSCG